MPKKQVFIIFSVLVCFNVLAWIAVYDLSHQDLRVVFFDVGQGDATLIKTPPGHHILIDGGPSSMVLEKLGQEMPFWNRNIDLVILTHPHYDHLAGLLEVLQNYQVKNVLWTGVLTSTLAFEKWQELLGDGQFDVHIAQAGQQIHSGQVMLNILYPPENMQNQRSSDLDDTSTVVKVVFGENSFLFTGDLSREAERELLEKGIDLDSDVLQVGHHGSRTSTDPEFIEAVLPDLAVISLGRDNKHGHPHQETLDTLESYGVAVLRTDWHGDIKISTDCQGRYLLNYQDYDI